MALGRSGTEDESPPGSWSVGQSELAFVSPPVATGQGALASADAYIVSDADGLALESVVVDAPDVTIIAITERLRLLPNPLGGEPIAINEGATETSTRASDATITMRLTGAPPDALITMSEVVASGELPALRLAFAPQRQDFTTCGGGDAFCRFTYDYPAAIEVGGLAGSGLAVTSDGPLRARFIEGVRLVVESADGTSEFVAGARSTQDAGSPAVTTVEHTTLYVEAATSALSFDGRAGGAVIGLSQPTLTLDGTLRSQSATGTLDAGDRIVSVSGEAIELTGRITMSLAPGPAPDTLVASSRGGRGEAMTATIGGSASHLSVAGVEYGVPPWRESERVVVATAFAALVAVLIEKARAAGVLGLGPLFSRLRRDRVLDNETRSRIYELVQRHPGIHFRGISAVLGNTGAVAYHLDRLVGAGLVARRPEGPRVRYYPSSALAEGSAPSPLGDRILATLRAEGEFAQRDLAERLGCSKQSVSYHVRRLRAAGMIASSTRDGTQMLRAT